MKDTVEPLSGLDLLRKPFPANQISKLPKPTKKQTDDLKEAMNRRDFSLGIRCKECGQWHHKDVVHLDYVGHAALTDRLLDCDPNWNWEPLAFNERGAPLTDDNGGMWIRLTVCGVTRLGYGHADGKRGGDAVKEVIGDALRNAAMRFGAALDLWHKGDLHADEEPEQSAAHTVSPDQFVKLRDKCEEAGVDPAKVCQQASAPSLEQFPADKFEAAMKRLQLTIDQKKPADDPLDGDTIPHQGDDT